MTGDTGITGDHALSTLFKGRSYFQFRAKCPIQKLNRISIFDRPQSILYIALSPVSPVIPVINIYNKIKNKINT
jgi:hypothetical protein